MRGEGRGEGGTRGRMRKDLVDCGSWKKEFFNKDSICSLENDGGRRCPEYFNFNNQERTTNTRISYRRTFYVLFNEFKINNTKIPILNSIELKEVTGNVSIKSNQIKLYI